jgi:predicted aspartyl protease
MKQIPRLWTVAVKLVGPLASRSVRAIVDTGANTTLMPPEVLLAVGCDPTLSNQRAGMLTASGVEYLAIVSVPEVTALGHSARDLNIFSHSLPYSGNIDGILGMDFLLQLPEFQELDKNFKKFFV